MNHARALFSFAADFRSAAPDEQASAEYCLDAAFDEEDVCFIAALEATESAYSPAVTAFAVVGYDDSGMRAVPLPIRRSWLLN
jgi:hypothetical protein